MAHMLPQDIKLALFVTRSDYEQCDVLRRSKNKHIHLNPTKYIQVQ